MNFIKGIVVEIESSYIVLENNGIGYEIYTPNPYSFTLNKEYMVYVYEKFAENEHTLYGFINKDEKELFLKLISVKGLGPKMALPMIALGSISGIEDAIERENILYIKKFPKIGDKLAKQIILDLKGKLNYVATGNVVNPDVENELRDVLLGLGYKDKEIKPILVKVDNTLSIEDQVKEALKLLLK